MVYKTIFMDYELLELKLSSYFKELVSFKRENGVQVFTVRRSELIPGVTTYSAGLKCMDEYCDFVLQYSLDAARTEEYGTIIQELNQLFMKGKVGRITFSLQEEPEPNNAKRTLLGIRFREELQPSECCAEKLAVEFFVYFRISLIESFQQWSSGVIDPGP
jgi:hypothetical protein